MRRLLSALAIGAVIVTAGCSNMSATEQRTLSGGAIGAGAGAAVSGLTGGSVVGGAILGGAPATSGSTHGSTPSIEPMSGAEATAIFSGSLHPACLGRGYGRHARSTKDSRMTFWT